MLDQLLKNFKYLRQEKDIDVSKADIIHAEHIRLKSHFDAFNQQYGEAKTVQRETLNFISDSNSSLRQERD